jgi:hypothetical protein
MNPDGGGSTGTPGTENGTGRPIRALMELERETTPDFMSKVRNKIYRRTATSQVAAFSWHLPKVILIEMAGLLTYLFRAIGTEKDSQP